MKTADMVHTLLVDIGAAYSEPTCYGNRIKNNHPEIAPLYDAFKRAAVEGTGRVPSHPITEREQRFFEQIIFSMEDFFQSSVAKKCVSIRRIVRRSPIYRYNLLKFDRNKIRRNMNEVYENMTIKAKAYRALKK